MTWSSDLTGVRPHFAVYQSWHIDVLFQAFLHVNKGLYVSHHEYGNGGKTHLSSNFVNSVKKSAIKRDGPVFFSPAPVKVAGDERTIMAIVAPRRGETSRPADISSGRANLPVCPN
jgi:hypothetical protein